MALALKIKKTFKDEIDLTIKFYTLLNILNNLKLTSLEIKIISYVAVKGNISRGNPREKFVSLLGSTYKSVSKTVAKLTRQGILIKDSRKTIINPSLVFNINGGIALQLNMGYEQGSTD